MKKIIIKILVGILVLAGIYVVFALSIVTNGFKTTQAFCTQYITQIESYKLNTGKYPKSLSTFEKSIFDFRYDFSDCGYRYSDEGFTFYFSDGFIGVAGYDSQTEEWWFD